MKNLLYKEFKLSGAILTYLFLAFTLMAFIPNYPILVSSFFICLGIFYTFQSARENNDTMFTALLPVRKQDVVKARFLFVCLIQLSAVLLFGVFVAIRLTVMSGSGVYLANSLTNANLSFIGYVLIVFALFNGVFLGKFYKTAYNVGIPFVIFTIIAFAFLLVTETLHFIPGLEFLNVISGSGLRFQLIVLGLGIIAYILTTYLVYRKSAMSFKELDL